MKLTVRNKEIELKPLTFKDWVEAEKNGLDVNRMSAKKRCVVCNGAGHIVDSDNVMIPCETCKGTGRVADMRLVEMWHIVQMTFRRAGLEQTVIDDLSIDEVMGLFGSGEIINFISGRAEQPLADTLKL